MKTLWLNVAAKWRVDGFQARCLRRILNIAPAYVSRVSNRSVLEAAGQAPYSAQLLKHQLTWFGKLGRADDQDILRELTLQLGTILPAAAQLHRRRGRPRSDWATCLHQKVHSFFGSSEMLFDCVRDERRWREFVENHINEF